MPDQPAHRGEAAILVVDDNAHNLLAMQRLLDGMAVDVVSAASGREALSHLLRREFAVVLLDVQMPEMDGFETARLMRQNKRTSSTPIIFVTAISKEERHVFRGYETGAVDYLFKPLESEIVRGKVRVFLELHRQRNELRQAYAALERRNQELHEFASVAAHDLVAPLDKLVAFVQRLRKAIPGDAPSKVEMYLDAIDRSARQMTEFVDALLAYARSGASGGTPAPVDLAAVVREALERLESVVQRSHARVEVGPMPAVLGDHMALVQVFQNLIANALKFRGDAPPVVKLGAETDLRSARISVSDNGIGIAPDDHARIFAAFSRLHSRDRYEGSGIGLATCAKLVERQGGRICVESQLGKGSVFYVSLPVGGDGCAADQLPVGIVECG